MSPALNIHLARPKHLFEAPEPSVPLGIPAFDEVLPDGGLPRGQVVELSVPSAMGLATSVALWACRAAQKRAQLEGADAWCAFVDPSRSLFAPGVAAAGVDLSRLLVVQPNFDAVDRIALKLAEARVFSTLVIDHVAESWELRTRSAVAKQLERVVRRLALAVDGTGSQVLLLTDSSVKRSSPLPVALRLELRRQGARDLWVSVAKDKRGRVQPPRRIQLETQLASAPINEPTPFVQRVA